MVVINRLVVLFLAVCLQALICFSLVDPVFALLDEMGPKIVELFPNPEQGKDLEDETITIQNFGDGIIDLSGWKLQNKEGKSWLLTGALGRCQQMKFYRQGQDMELSNDEDFVELVDPSGNIVDAVSYFSSNKGQSVVFSQLESCRLTSSQRESLNRLHRE
jgi:hypothetical protein